MSAPKHEFEIVEDSADESASAPAAKPSLVLLIAAGVAMALSVGWFVVARQGLLDVGAARDRAALKLSSGVFAGMVEQVQWRLKAQVQVMSEDPRLKSILSTPGIDEATVVDVLNDLRKLSGAELIAVMNASARVQAVVGEDSFRGVDLSSSSVVGSARQSPGAVSGTWVVGERVMNISVAAIRFADRIAAYLVVGASLPQSMLDGLHELTHTEVATVVGGKVVSSAPSSAEAKARFRAVAEAPAAFEERAFSLDGGQFLARVEQIEGAIPPARVVWLRSSERTLEELGMLRAFLWIPMVIVTLLGALAAWRSLGR